VTAVPKLEIVRDKKWAQGAVRDLPSIVTGLCGPTVEGMHISTLGKSIKSSDAYVLPIEHYYHQLGHEKGEISMLREHLPDYVLRRALQLYAQYELYEPWKSKN